MAKMKLNRRTLLRGIAGTAVALPFLEIMDRGDRSVRADVGDAPTRFLLAFAGMSLGTTHDLFVPDTVGYGYDLKRALSPLGTRCETSGLPGFEVASEISVVSGLTVPWRTGGVTPDAGRSLAWHSEQLAPLLTGMKAGPGGDSDVQSPTADQIVADHHAGATSFRNLAYRVQPSVYRGSRTGGGFAGRISYRERSDGSIEPVDGVVSPRAAYETLFAGFAATDPEEEARRQFEMSRRRSILDLVGRQQRESLIGRLGAADRTRMERHFDHIRDLELRLEGLDVATGGACRMLEHPGADPEVGGASRAPDMGDFIVDEGYSNEEERARIMSDLIAMALACDLTRSVSLMYTLEQSYMMPNRLPGMEYATVDMHAMSHAQGGPRSERPRYMADLLAWHTRHFGYLVDQLRTIEDAPGSSVLDNTVAVFLPEGGHGFDPATGNDDSPHSSENMAMLVAGRAGGLQPGQHIVAPSDRDHPGNVLVSALQATGIDTDRYGAVRGGVDALFG